MYNTQLLLQMDNLNILCLPNKTELSKDTEKQLMPSRCQQADVCLALEKNKGNESLPVPPGMVTSQ